MTEQKVITESTGKGIKLAKLLSVAWIMWLGSMVWVVCADTDEGKVAAMCAWMLSAFVYLGAAAAKWWNHD